MGLLALLGFVAPALLVLFAFGALATAFFAAGLALLVPFDFGAGATFFFAIFATFFSGFAFLVAFGSGAGELFLSFVATFAVFFTFSFFAVLGALSTAFGAGFATCFFEGSIGFATSLADKPFFESRSDITLLVECVGLIRAELPKCFFFFVNFGADSSSSSSSSSGSGGGGGLRTGGGSRGIRQELAEVRPHRVEVLVVPRSPVRLGLAFRDVRVQDEHARVAAKSFEVHFDA